MMMFVVHNDDGGIIILYACCLQMSFLFSSRSLATLLSRLPSKLFNLPKANFSENLIEEDFLGSIN